MEEIEDDNGRKFTEVKPNNLAQQNQQRLLNQNPQPQPQQVRALQIENRAINDVNNDEIQEDEPLNPEGPGFFKKHWKSILIIILVILVVSGSIFAVSFLTRTKFKNIKSLVLTRQLNQFETYQYGKNSDICATSVNAKQNSKHCQKVEADYKFYVLNITDRPYLPNYIEYESNEKDKSELDVMKVDLKSNFIGLWLKSLDVIIDGKKFELVKTRFEFTDPNFKFDYEDKRHLNEFLNINLDNKKEVEKLLLAQEIALDPEEELEKIKKTTSTIIFFNMWDSGEISSIFVPEDLPEFAKIFMKDLIKDYSPNLDKTNYDGGKRLLQGEYSLKDSTIRKSLTKSNIEKVQLPEDSLFESNIDYKFNDVFDLTETNQNTKIGFFHSKKKGEMPSKRNQNLFSNNFEVNNEEDELQNFIPNFDMSEISTTSSVKTELKNKYVSHNETELFVFLASQNQFEVHIGDLHDVNIVEIKGSGKLKTGEDEIKLTDVGYHYGESKYIELENYLKGKVHYKKQFKSQIDIRDDIKEVLFNEDVSQIHSIVYPAFNVDVYGVRCHMHIVLEVCPSQDYIESKIVIGSVGLFSFDLFSVKKQVGMSDSIDKMFNYIKKATNVVATTLSIIDRFLNSDLLKKLKDKVDEVGAKTGIDTNDIFVDYFGKFLSELDEKLLTLSQDFKEKLIQNKNYLLNPLISFYKKYETIVKDIYDKYIKSSSEKVDNFLLERQTEITDFLDGLPKLTALFYPDMIEFIQSGQDKIKEKINNLPGTIKIGFVNTASRKLTEILNKTQELLEKVKEKIISYFDLIPFEELKKSKDYISGEINSLLTSSGSEIAKYKKFIEDHFFIEEFNPISLAGQKAFERIEVNLEAIKTHMKNAMKELKIEEYREIFNLLVEYMKKVLNIDVKDSLLNFPEFKSIVNEFLKNYLTEFNFNNKNSLINSISDLAENALNVAKSTFYEKFIRVNGIVSSFKTKLQNLSNMNNYNSLIESIFSLTFDEFNLNKNDLLAIINKYLEVTEFGVSICEDRYKLLNEDITFISNKINEILDKIKSNSLDEILNIKKIDEIATTLGDFIDLLNYFDIDILDSLRPEKFRSKIEKTYLELEILIQNRFTFYLENAKYEIDNLKAKMNEIVSKFPRNQVKCEEDILKNCFLVKNKECIFNYYSIRKDLTLPKEFNNFISSAINQAKEFLVKLKNQVAELTIIKDEILNDLFSSAFKNYKSLEASVDMNLNIFFDSIYKKVDTFIKSSSSYINEISAQVLEFLTRKIINSYDKIPKFILNEIDNLKKILENIKIKDKSCENLETNNFFFKIRCQWSADINEKIISITNEFIQIRKNNFFNFFDPFAAKIETLPKLIKNKVKQEFNNIKIQFDNIFNNTQMLINKSISDTISYLQKNLNNLLDTLEGTFVSKVESMITQIENKNKENNIQLNGYFTVSKLYSTFSILKEINIFELDFGKILNFLNEGGVVNKDIFDGVTNINSLVKTNFSVELSKLLSIQKGLLKNEIEIDFDYLLDGLDKNINSQDFSPLINGFFEAFSSKFSTEFDNQKINFLVDFNTWKLKFINEISAFSNLPSISQNFKENLLNFISNITSEGAAYIPTLAFITTISPEIGE